MRQAKSLIPVLLLLLCSACVIGWSVSTSGRVLDATPLKTEAQRVAASRWEYRVVVMEGASNMSAEDLNKLGLDGWELVAVQRDATTTYMKKDLTYAGAFYYFKRQR